MWGSSSDKATSAAAVNQRKTGRSWWRARKGGTCIVINTRTLEARGWGCCQPGGKWLEEEEG
jgi:hypothetical protein